MAQNWLTVVSDLQGGRTRASLGAAAAEQPVYRGYLLEESLAGINRNPLFARSANLADSLLSQAAGSATWSLAIPTSRRSPACIPSTRSPKLGAVSAVSNAGDGEIR
jgi:hypothetical protein